MTGDPFLPQNRIAYNKDTLRPAVLVAALCLFVNYYFTQMLDTETLRLYLGFAYGIQIIILSYLYMWRHNFLLIRLLQPSFLTLMYIGISISLGGMAFSSGNIAKLNDEIVFYSLRNVHEIYYIITVCLFTLYCVAVCSPRTSHRLNYATSILTPVTKRSLNNIYIIGTVSCLFAASLLLTEGIVSQTKTVLFATLVYILFIDKNKARWIIVALLSVALAADSFDSKREVVFGLVGPAYMIFRANELKQIKMKTVIFITGATFVVIILILAMSIMRGYGGFHENSGLIAALLLVPSYIADTRIISLISLNMETSYLFLHLHNAVDGVLLYPQMSSNGETYIRPLFIGFIGDIAGYKPDSILQLYTLYANPDFRSIGGSFVITCIGEAVWNFGWYAPLFIAFLYYILDFVFLIAVSKSNNSYMFGTILIICGLQFSLYLARGSGLDLFVIYVVFGACVSAIICTLLLPFNNRHSGPRRETQIKRAPSVLKVPC